MGGGSGYLQTEAYDYPVDHQHIDYEVRSQQAARAAMSPPKGSAGMKLRSGKELAPSAASGRVSKPASALGTNASAPIKKPTVTVRKPEVKKVVKK